MDPEELRKLIEQAQTRTMKIVRGKETQDGRIPIAISSETAVDRGWYMEVLSHEKGAVVMGRAANGLPFLVDHDTSALAGRVEDIALEKDGVLRGMVRFGSSALAREIQQDVADGIRPDISVGYRILEYREEKRDGRLWVVATLWEPLETSSVPVPADAAVGVGRSLPNPGEASAIAIPPTPTSAHVAASKESRQMNLDEILKLAVARGVDPEQVRKWVAQGMTLESARDAVMSMSAPAPVIAPGAGATPTPTTDDGARAIAILDLAVGHGVDVDQARKWLADGMTVEQAREAILTKYRAAAKTLPTPGSETLEGMGASGRELENYSYARALGAALAMAEGRGQDAKCFEMDVAQQIARTMPAAFQARGGLIVPLQLKRTAIDSKTTNAAKELVFSQYGGEVIELLRNMSFLTRFGARVLAGLTSPISFPKQTGSATATWVSENPGSDVSESNLTTGIITLSPKTLQGTVAVSRQLMVQSSPDVESLVRQDLAAVHALAWDKAALHGAGGSAPTGLYTLAGVGSVAAGGAPTYAKLVDMVTAAAVANALLNSLGFVTTPEMAGKMAQTLNFSAAAAGSPIWDGTFEEGKVAGYRATATNQVAKTLGVGTDEHGCIFGAWSEIMIGQFGGGVEIIVDPYAKKKQGLVELTSFQMVDIQARHPEAFVKATGMK